MWFRRNREQAMLESLLSALPGALKAALDTQAAAIDQNQRFLRDLQDMSVKTAARALGARGGRKTQARRKERKDGFCCALGRDPFLKPPALTVELIAEHRKHQQAVEAEVQPQLGEAQ